MRFLFRLMVIAGSIFAPLVARAQDSVAHESGKWIIPAAGITTAVIFDGEVREWALREHTAGLEHLARIINPLGTGSHLVPAMALVWAASAVARDRSLADGTLKTAAAYAMNDIAESLLKPVIGRERPHIAGNPRRFRPFTGNGDWHSLPSAHVAHITSIAAAVAAQTQSRPVAAIGDVLITLMSWDRVYEDQHWTSDAALTITLSTVISRHTVRWIDSHWRHNK